MSDEEIFVTQSSMPSFDEYVEAIKPLWDTHRITNMGIYHRELEKKLKEFFINLLTKNWGIKLLALVLAAAVVILVNVNT